VRQRLTELGLDVVLHQVPAEPEDRDALREAAGTDEIPVLLREDGTMLEGEDAILGWLDEQFVDRTDADTHRAKALDKAGLPD
jgi:glutathione S-transferase